ncbi:MAG: hypothetical protein MUC83_18195 [Pirellula sp.]|nr:hypothetical protein [Pirellula sp.]
MSKRFFIKAVLLGITLCAIFIVLATRLTTSSRYKRTHDKGLLLQLFNTKIKPGDTMEHVIEVLGDGDRNTSRFKTQLLNRRDNGTLDPATFPDGILETDEIIFYAALPDSYYSLHFRNGRLINYSAARYAAAAKAFSSVSEP